MFIKINSLLLYFFLMQQAFATTPVYVDSVIHPAVSHLNQQQFLDTYGTNDTSRAVIQYYFKRNRNAKRDMLIWGTAGIAAGIAFDKVVVNGSEGDALGGLFLGILLGSFIYTGVIEVLLNSFNWIHFSRQRLALRLEKYNASRQLPKSLLRKSLFINLLAVERQLSRMGKQ